MIAEFKLDTPVLETALGTAPHTDVSIIQQIGAGDETLDLVINAAHGDCDAFERGLDADGTVVDWVRLGEGHERRYRVTLSERGRELSTFPRWSKDGAVFLDGARRRDNWRFRIQFQDEESLQRYVAYCEDEDIDVQPIRLVRTDSSTTSETFGLTATQARSLVAASERGFFKIPRECTLEELASDSEITHQALSERLRRGTESLVDSTIR